MTSSSDDKPFPNVPPPPGSRQGSPYTRFIPREELGDFQRWKPGDIEGSERRQYARSRDGVPPTVEEWRALVTQARQEGYQQGYSDGLVALENFKHSFTTQTSTQIGMLLRAFDEQMQALEERMAESVARTAILLARQVLRLELTTRPELVASLAADAVQAVQLSARHVVVRVHPEDLALVAQGAAEVLQARGARLQADPDIARGGCKVQSDADIVDGRLEARWTQACAALGVQLPWQPAAAGSEAGAQP
ncbi:MAG: flagellar assembly protein FliH [Pseudomonadota bacterium]|jgi:flagellar assembly protein FliH